MTHPNKVPFEGVLTFLDVPSDRSPRGARGHRVILRESAAKAALDSLIGMGVNIAPGYDKHDAPRKIGVITSATIRDKKIHVYGYIFGRDCEDAIEKMEAHAEDSGMSYELADAHVEDIRARVWTLTKATFTGAAILSKAKAAYKETSFRLLTPQAA